jgi:WD40 repeat protein
LFGGLVALLVTMTSQTSEVPSHRVLCGPPYAIRVAAFSPDGRTLATGGGLAPHAGELKLWDVASGTEQLTLLGQTGTVEALAFSPDGRLLASAGSDQTIRLWDSVAGREMARFQGHTNKCRSLAFSPDGLTLASASWDQTVRLWDVPTGRIRAVLRVGAGWCPALAFNLGGELLATWGGDRDVELWEVATGRQHTTLQMSTNGPAQATGSANWVLAYGPKGPLLARGASANNLNDVFVERLDTARPPGGCLWTGDLDWVSAFAFSPEGQCLAVGSWDGTVKVWEADTGREHAMFGGHPKGVTFLALSPDGRCLAAGCADNTVFLWEWPTSQWR